ncbi:asparagine synthase (glutamine-hydrolysing) [Myxococcaceae bacterium]|jgi:asparagine synthase (glutamine-hydrolysing)|nr:asparagine synthase (glutamine-hydrolysing) [Myxococcaceae bacterium]
MCGIVGTIALRGARSSVSPDLLRAMRDAMQHRGPDGEGLWISPDGRAGLGHRRLSIVDLSVAAAQPMTNDDESLVLSFNGEIYNHVALREELERIRPRRWKTNHSDTEVLLRAFEEWGIDCVERLRGMFAFSVFDAKRRRLWLVRDRIGVKPLYVTRHAGSFHFASEIKALLEVPGLPREVDPEALVDFLSFLTTPGPATLFTGIRKLAAGTWLRVDEDGTEVERRYWDVWDHASPGRVVNEAQAVEAVFEKLREAVALRKMADVPVGLFLSGGIDSGTNAVLFSEGESEPVRTFSIGYDRDYESCPSELPAARKLAERVGAIHAERVLGIDDLVKILPRMVELQDEPLADPVCVPVYYVSELARRSGVKVCQVGEGADELFFGYPSWRRALRLQQWDDLPVPRLAKRLAHRALGAAGRGGRIYTEWLRRGASGVPIFWGGAEGFTEAAKREVIGPRIPGELGRRTGFEALAGIRSRFLEAAWEPSIANWMTYVDLRLRLPELLLMRVDKMSMGVSLEARVPFLDHELVELVLSIPSGIKTGGGELKHLLKEVVRRHSLLPDEVIDRPKQGFAVPVHEWLLGALGPRVAAEVDAFSRESGLLDPSGVSRLVASGRTWELWVLFNLAIWWRRFIAG